MKPPSISVVIPTFNGSRFIRDAIASCRSQTKKDWELIVVDDGSTDGTAAIVRELMHEEPRLQLIEHKRNCCLPKALNTGFARARGTYCTWIADDNMYRPRAFEVMAAHLDLHPKTGLVYAGATIVDECENAIRYRPAASPDALYERNPVGWCFMYRAGVRKQIGDYDPDLFLAEDYDYWLRIAIHYEVSTIDQDLFIYRQHEGSLTSTRTAECRRAQARAQYRSLDRLPGVSRADKALVYYELGAFFARNRQPISALSCLARSVWQDPRVAGERWRRRARKRMCLI